MNATFLEVMFILDVALLIFRFWQEDIPKLFKKKASAKKGKEEL